MFYQINPNFAIDLIAEDPVVVCEQRVVSSDSGGALGHPKVFINLVRYDFQFYTGKVLLKGPVSTKRQHQQCSDGCDIALIEINSI